MVDDGEVLVRKHPHPEHERRGILGSAIAALIFGVAAAVLLLPAPGIAFTLGLAAMTAGLVSRRRLMTDTAVNGSRLSLAGFLLGCVVALLAGLKFAAPYLIVTFADVTT